MDQDIVGSAGIASEEAFGVDGGGLHQLFIVGVSGIPSAEAFGQTNGVRIPIETVPVAAWYSY